MRWRWVDVLLIVFLALLPQLYFWRLFPANPADQKTLEDGDLNQEHFPVIVTVARALGDGALPLWNPYSNGGQPLLADPQSALLYPPTWGTLLATRGYDGDSFVALERQIPLHFSLLGVFTYVLGRVLLRSRLGAIIAALTFTYSGFLTTYPVQQLPILRAIAWLPLQVLGLWLALERRSWGWAAFAGAALGMAVLAGHPQTVFQQAIVLGVTSLVWAYQHWAATREWRQPVGFALRALPLIGVIALGLSAVQLLPSYEFLRHSNRAAVDYGFVSGGYAFWELPLDFLAPRILGGLPPYVGILPLILAAAALMLRRDRLHGWAVTLGVVGLVLSLGGNSFVYSGAYAYVPGFALFRDQERAIFMFSFAVAILAGSGAALLTAMRDRADFAQVSSLIRRLQWLLVGALALGMALYVFHVNAEVTDQGAIRWRGIVAWWFWFVLMLGFSLAIVFLHARNATARPLTPVLLVALVILDLFTVSWDQPLTDHFPNDLFRASGIVNRTLAEIGVARAYDEGVLNGYHGLIYGIPTVNRILAMHLDRFHVAVDRIPQDRLFDLLNVRYITTRQPRSDGELLMQERWEQFTNLLYRRGGGIGPAWLVPRAESAASAEDALRRVADPGFDPRAAVIIERPGEAERAGATGQIESYQRGWNEVATRVTAPQGGYLVFSEIAYPGWRAYVDDRPVPLLTANYILRALWLDPGEHDVRLEYWPLWVLAGAAISALTLLILAGWMLLTFVRPRT